MRMILKKKEDLNVMEISFELIFSLIKKRRIVTRIGISAG